MRRRLRRGGSGEPVELNITTFMNLMVVLVPFLLLSAVFSEITIHDLNLPSLSEPAPESKDDKPKLQLEVVIRRASLDVIDRNSGRLKLIPGTAAGHDFAALNQLLQQVKAQYPQVSTVTLLLEPETSYNTLIGAMDAVRAVEESAGGKAVKRELFPDVSIGDAPSASKEEAAP